MNTKLVAAISISILFYLQFTGIAQDQAKLQGDLKLYFLNAENQVDSALNTTNSILLAHADWSLNSEIVRKEMLEIAFGNAVDGCETISFYIIGQEVFDYFQTETNEKSDGKVEFNVGCRERGALLLIDSDGQVEISDPEILTRNNVKKINTTLIEHERAKGEETGEGPVIDK